MRDHLHNLAESLPVDPMPLAGQWLAQAWDERVQPNPNAMVLATLGEGSRLSARVVLCKDLVADPGYLVFYTNYRSRKGHELDSHGRAAAVFHWDTLQRQVRVEGVVVRSPAAESDDYFDSRPWRSRLAARASQQSQPIGSRDALLARWRETAAELGAPDPLQVPEDEVLPGLAIARPAHWGGYRLWADAVELWVEGEHRLHDRARWTRELTGLGDGRFATGPWQHHRLQP